MNKKRSIIFSLFILAAALLVFLFSRTGYGTVALKRISTFNHFVIDGRKGWLFYRGDLDYVLLPWSGAAKNLFRIDSIAKQNKATLIIIPVPNKIDLYPEYLEDKLGAFSYLKNKSARLMSLLKQRDVAILDLYDTYRKAKESMPIYDPDEAHVTSYGIKIAAEETVKKFFPRYFRSDTTCLGKSRIAFLGNLAEKKNDSSAKREIEIYCNACSREKDTAVKDTVLIVGDSYCNYLEQYRGGFRDLLESNLTGHYLFQTYYQVDAGFKLSGRILSLVRKKPKHKIIIWLFTAREFYKPLLVE
jgi:hypothetical protein